MATVPALSPEEIELLQRGSLQPMTLHELGKWLRDHGYQHSTNPNALSNLIYRHRLRRQQHVSALHSEDDPLEQRLQLDTQQEAGTIVTIGPQIKTPEEAFKAAKLDPKIWEIERSVVNYWTATVGALASGSNKEPIQVTNWQVKVWIRRKKPVLIGLEEAVENLSRRRAAQPLRLRPGKPHGSVLCVVGLVDSHFGKLAWRPETGENYDLRIARKLFEGAAEDIIRRSKPFGVSRWVLPLGNDFFHFQNQEASTPRSGNILDRDGRLAKVMEMGALSAIRAVEMLAQTGGQVDVLWVRDNHAPEASWWLCRMLAAHFRGAKNVHVDTSPASRKYILHGVTLLGFYHGHEIKLNALPRIMADDRREDFARARFREWLCGHFHKRQRIEFLGTDSAGATTARVLPSLCGTDAWHYEHGFSGGPKSAEAYLYGEESGYDGHIVVYAPEEVLAG